MTAYRREIDGLRALAVISVILFHAGFESFSGGFIGVDVFFVISGYLITSIILAQKESGTFSLLNFYERRARRILPALFLIIAVCIPFSWFLLIPREMKDFSESIAAVSLFLSNHLFASEKDYFDTASELKPLLHTWSLAVEEQYYVLFPLFLLLMWRFAERFTVVTISVIAASSFALAQWGAYNKPTATFFLLPTRGWEIAIGALLAFYFARYPKQPQRLVQELGSLIGALLILSAVFFYTKQTPFPSVYALAPTLGTAFIVLCATPATLVGRILGTKPLVGIGLISYSAYLWHQPLFAFARQLTDGEPHTQELLLLSITSLMLAFITWKYVELPLRDRKLFNRTQIFLYSFCISLAFFVIGLSGLFFSDKFETYWLSRLTGDQAQFYSQVVSTNKSLHDYGRNANGVQQLSDCRFNLAAINEEVSREILRCAKKHGAGILILGDSHAIDLYGVVVSRFDNEFLIGLTSGGCRPHSPKPECQYDLVLSFLQKNKNVIKHIIYEQSGSTLLLDRKGNKGTQSMFSNLRHSDPVDWISIDDEHIIATINYLDQLSQVTPITWFLPRIEPHISKKFLIKNGCQYAYQLRNGLQETFSRLDETIKNYIEKRPAIRIKVVSQNKTFGFHFPGDFLSCTDLYWTDGDHFSAAGERRFGRRLPDNFLSF